MQNRTDYQRVYMRKWREQNPDKVKAIKKRYYNRKSKHTARATLKAWYQANKEAIKLKNALQLKTLAEARAILGANDAGRESTSQPSGSAKPGSPNL